MGHFYHTDGTSCHEVKAKTTGKMRPTTVRDAREMGLLPSVSTVLDLCRKPQLESWKMDQAALTVRRLINVGRPLPEDDREFCDYIRKESMSQVDDAADLGTAIHEAIEQAFTGKTFSPELDIHVQAVRTLVHEHGIMFQQHELTVTHLGLMYAGKTDASFTRFHEEHGKQEGILDFKSRKSRPGEPMLPWDGQATQIAAYAFAHYGTIADHHIGANVFLSTTEPGRAEIVWYTAEELRREFEIFNHLLRAYQLRNNL